MENQGEPSESEQAYSRQSYEDKVYNDCVHGYIKLPSVCVKIINTPTFHRLRNLKQMGFCYRVYPAASHNRFEHSLGVSYLAGEMVDILNDGAKEPWIKGKEKLCLQIAGLCHDLGHGPFSHSWETFVNKAQDTEDADHPDHFTHEEMSTELLDIIWEDREVIKELDRLKMDEDDLLFIKDLILGLVSATNDTRRTTHNISKQTTDNFKEGRLYLYEIINNVKTGIDVDKWDYLFRDGKQLNIGMSFDHRRLMRCLRICKTTTNGTTPEYHICYRDKVKDTILQMYTMRAELHRRAAQHRVVKCLDAMWVDALLAADEEGYKFHGNLLKKTHKKAKVYEKLNDQLFDEILYSTGPKYEKSRKLLKRIISRKLYTCFSKQTLGTQTSDNPRGSSQRFTKKKIISEIYKRVKARREIKKIDLFVTHTELKLPNLPDSVYLYSKNGGDAVLQNKREWRNEQTFPPESFEVYRQDVFFYYKQKTMAPDKMAELKEEVQEIMREVETSN